SVRDTLGFIYIDAQETCPAPTEQVYVNDLYTLRRTNPFGDFTHLLDDGFASVGCHSGSLIRVPPNKKVGLRPLAGSTPRAIIAGPFNAGYEWRQGRFRVSR